MPRQPVHRRGGQHRAPLRPAPGSPSSSTTSPATSGCPGRSTPCCTSPARPRRSTTWSADPDAEGRQPRHPQRPGAGQGQGARFLLASTSEVYGDPSPPAARDLLGQRQPDRAARRLRRGQALRRGHDHGVPPLHGVDVRIVRIFNTYGPRMRPDDGRVVPNFIVQALRGEPLTIYGDGTQTRSFCYVATRCGASWRCSTATPPARSTSATRASSPMLELAELVLEVTGSSSEIVFEPLPVDDPRQRQPDITLARQRARLGARGRPARGLERHRGLLPRARLELAEGRLTRSGAAGLGLGAVAQVPLEGAAQAVVEGGGGLEAELPLGPAGVDAAAGLTVGLGGVPADLALVADQLDDDRRPARGWAARWSAPRLTGSPPS